MVSLVNFKMVHEELQQQQQDKQTLYQVEANKMSQVQSQQQHLSSHNDDRTQIVKPKLSTSVNIVQVNRKSNEASSNESTLKLIVANPSQRKSPQVASEHQQQQQQPNNQSFTSFTVPQQQQQQQQSKGALAILSPPHKPALFNELAYLAPNEGANNNNSSNTNSPFPFGAPAAAESSSNFVVTWRNLRFAIEPKWHQKLSHFGPVAAVSNCMAQQAAEQPSTKVVLDRLDGSFRSGELTAILGPSGAGKTTLLDCLTGHRKAGLSGSIKISASDSSLTARPLGAHNKSLSFNSHHHQHYALNEYSSNGIEQQTNGNNRNLNNSISDQNQVAHQVASQCMPTAKANSQTTTSSANLKVSIIPQNDHLIGHLTVYETLNYASKMKNCFEQQFDHKLNIKRVAQQLGLMSCLGTRINKLSGGQYKRVSIAQELLSSPDILILDEPTSGLDAMTCYQTVQVLRKLTDERQTNGLKQIAVILTIHQPNSDVFQQFNHVYVVAQGGKCIYEGPPANIESVINRIGIRLPNSHYNPATMIVEIAAGKFSQDSIQKLNGIQKKQYDFIVPDEQNSTGDSAVDCPSSSSCSNDEADDDDDGDDNNNNMNGRVNRGFELEDDDEKIKTTKPTSDSNNNDNNNNLNSVVVVGTGGGGGGNHHNDDTDSVSKIKLAGGENGNDNEGRRKKRRRTRRRASEPENGNQQQQVNSNGNQAQNKLANQSLGCRFDNGAGSDDEPKREKRVKLNSLKADQRFPFWRHTYLHFHRSWLSIVRDPLLCSMQLALHIMVPLMVSVVYGTNVGKPNACPRAGPVDIMAYALEPTDAALQLQEDLRTTLENIGYIFFKLYGIIFAAMTVTVLTFPLDMHVLVKEFRNGWYGLSSYFLGRTLADIPFQLTLPLLAMSLSYYATGQPYSYFQWRFFSITAILILSSLIAQSQGLLFGAILMDRMKAAVFVAPAATTPIILFAGFLVRTQSIPRYLRPLSNLSYLRYAIEACLISRYGFNQCECDPAVFNQTVPELPPIARSMLDYWLSSFKPAPSEGHELGSLSNSTAIIETTTAATEVPSMGASPDLFTKLIDSLARANSFGRNITSCEQVVPYPMIDYDLKDSQLFNCFGILLFMLVFTRLLTFFIVCFKVKRKV